MEKVEHSASPAAAPSESLSVEIGMSFAAPAEQDNLNTASESPSAEIGMSFAAPAEQDNQNTLASPSLSHPHHIYPEWLALIMGFCFTAIGIGLQCQDSIHLSISLHTARLGLVFALSAFVVSRYIPPNLGAHAQVLEYAGVFCGVTAFFLAITVTFPLCLKIISWIIYAISFIAIIISCSWDIFK